MLNRNYNFNWIPPGSDHEARRSSLPPAGKERRKLTQIRSAVQILKIQPSTGLRRDTAALSVISKTLLYPPCRGTSPTPRV